MPAKADPPEERMDPGDGSAQLLADAAASSSQAFLSQVARAPKDDPVAATKAGAGSKRKMGDPKRTLPSSSNKGKRSPSSKWPQQQQQPGFGSPSGSLTLSSGKHSVNYVVKSSFNAEVIRRAAGTEKFGTARDTESPVNETAEERRLRKNRVNERRKRARRAMKIDYLNEQFHNLIADNSRMKDENELLKQHIAAVRAGEIPASLFQSRGSAEETSTGSGESPAEQQQDQASAALTDQVESNPNVASASQDAGGAMVSSATTQQNQGISPEIFERLVVSLVTGANQESLQGRLAGVPPEILQRLLTTSLVAGSNQEGLHGQLLAGASTGMQGITVGDAQLPSDPYRFRSIDASNHSSHSESRQRSNTDEQNLLAMRLLSRASSTAAPPAAADSITSGGNDTGTTAAGSGRGVMGVTDPTNRSDILQQARSLSELSPETRRNVDALIANLGAGGNPPAETTQQPQRPNFQVPQGGPSASFNDALVALLRSQQQQQQPHQEWSQSQSAASAASDVAMQNQNLQPLLSQQQLPSESESILVSFLRQSLQSDRQREETQRVHELLREQQRQQQEEILVQRRQQQQEQEQLQQQQLLQHLQQLQEEEHRQREEQNRQRELLQRLQEEQRQKEERQRQQEALQQLQDEQRQREDLQRQQVVLQFQEERRQRERQQQEGIYQQMQEGQRGSERQLLEGLLRRLQGQEEERQREHQEGQRQRQQEMLLVQQLRLMHESQQLQQQPGHGQTRQQQGGNPPHGPLLRLHRQHIAGVNNAPEPPPAPSANLASNIDLGRFLMGQRDYQPNLHLAPDGSRSNNPAAPNDAPGRGTRPQPPYEDSKRRDDCDEDDYPGIDRNILYRNRKGS